MSHPCTAKAVNLDNAATHCEHNEAVTHWPCSVAIFGSEVLLKVRLMLQATPDKATNAPVPPAGVKEQASAKASAAPSAVTLGSTSASVENPFGGLSFGSKADHDSIPARRRRPGVSTSPTATSHEAPTRDPQPPNVAAAPFPAALPGNSTPATASTTASVVHQPNLGPTGAAAAPTSDPQQPNVAAAPAPATMPGNCTPATASSTASVVHQPSLGPTGAAAAGPGSPPTLKSMMSMLREAVEAAADAKADYKCLRRDFDSLQERCGELQEKVDEYKKDNSVLNQDLFRVKQKMGLLSPKAIKEFLNACQDTK